MNEPQTWHYGLVAKWWMEFKVGGPEIEHVKRLIQRHGEPALDVACGTGRVSLPLLAEGFDVDAADISEDMLDCYRELAKREGVKPSLYCSAMHELDLPRKYRTIFIPGSFGIGGEREHDLRALRRCYELLEPGGVLAFDYYMPYVGEPGRNLWRYWLDRPELPEAFPDSGHRRTTSDGSELETVMRVVDFDPWNQVLTREMRVREWAGGRMTAEENRRLIACIYLPRELDLMMKHVGFENVQVFAGWTDNPPRPYEHGPNLLFVGRK